MKSIRFKSGFTLIELLVVIAVIGILAAVILASLNSARAKARDARRKSDLRQVATALELYRDTYGTYAVAGSGAASVPGNGWFSYMNAGDSYPKAVGQGLVDAGFMPTAVVDPSGQTTSNGTTQSGYMIAADANTYTIWANLENPSAADTATQNTCRLSNYDSYASSYPAPARMNYCIGN
jgi:prepilin-type N-terminal cleavage/methylation domain-containing protein